MKSNGRRYELRCEPRETLADLLRRRCGLTQVHLGCEHGVCGACTVLLDGRTARSCCILAVQAGGRVVTTFEGISEPGSMHPLQESFYLHHGLQCGFCTPGMVLTAMELLAEDPRPTRETVRERIAGNLCRCTGYQAIVDSIVAVTEPAADGSTPQ